VIRKPAWFPHHIYSKYNKENREELGWRLRHRMSCGSVRQGTGASHKSRVSVKNRIECDAESKWWLDRERNERRDGR